MKQTYDVVDKGTNSSVNKLRETKHSEFFYIKKPVSLSCILCSVYGVRVYEILRKSPVFFAKY